MCNSLELRLTYFHLSEEEAFLSSFLLTHKLDIDLCLQEIVSPIKYQNGCEPLFFQECGESYTECICTNFNSEI